MSICYPREYAVIAMLPRVRVEFAKRVENDSPGNDFVARSSGYLASQENELLVGAKNVSTIFKKIEVE